MKGAASTAGRPRAQCSARTRAQRPQLPILLPENQRPSCVGRCRAAGQGFAPPQDTGSVKKKAQAEKAKIEDKLIAAFQSKPVGDWRKLMAFSKKWPTLADGVFKRVEHLISSEGDPDRKLKLRRFLRSLNTAHADVQRFRELFDAFEAAEAEECEAVVAGHRDIIGPAFFEYLKDIVAASHEEPERQQQLVTLGSRIAAIHSAFERAAADAGSLEGAEAKFKTLLEVESMEEAEGKIDAMAASGELDPAFLLTMAKAYSGVKETDYTREEVKDVMYHLYTKAKEATARQAPPEVRILKHLLSIDDPRERLDALDKAFEKGPALETPQEDLLSTDPKKLMITVEAVLGAYEGQKGRSSMIGQAADLMDPAVVGRLKDLKETVHKRFM